MIRVITIAREYGSGGDSIAKMLAELLGWKLIDRELIGDLAKRIHCSPEVVSRHDKYSPSVHSQVMRSYWTDGADTWAVIPCSHVLNEESLAATTGVLIREAAQLGHCIILGRASQCLLRDRSDTFHVFVYAPVEERVWRLLGRYPNELDAEVAMTEIDRARAAYLRKYFDRDWNDRYLYDLILNSMTGDAAVLATILAACKLNPEHA